MLDDAQAVGVKVILTMFSLPGARWKQLNDDQDDGRLWRDLRYHEQAASFWRQLAEALDQHPAIAAYNPLNEPHPEKTFGFQHSRAPGFSAWADSVKGSAADVNRFNRTIVDAIRDSDPATPVLLDGGFYASPAGLRRLEPLSDPTVLYAFHFYEPWIFATFRVNRGRFSYPDSMPGEGDARVRWSIDDLRDRMAAVAEWTREHEIPPHRVIASEFGCDRRVGGAREYLEDVITVLNENTWHWAFYAFRDDGGWGGLDYELGTGKLGWAYWQAVERGEDPEALKKRHDNPLWAVIRRQLDPAARR